MWLSPWGYSKVLFLLARYVPVTGVCFMLRDQLFPDLSAKSCLVESLLDNCEFTDFHMYDGF